jgi:hypothetical protein
MPLGDGIRRNIAQVDPTERAMLRDAFLELNRRVFPGSRTDAVPGGVTYWFKQDEIHQSTHVHGGPEFLPWHREIVNRLEALLREINPLLSLHYWDWTQDPRAISGANLGGGSTGNLNLFTPDFMGYGGATDDVIGPPWQNAVAPFRADGYYVPGASPERDGAGGTPADPPREVNRFVDGSPVTVGQDNAVLSQGDYAAMRGLLEGEHNAMHGFVNMGGQHISFRDPFVFLLHSNVDRLFARWQTDPAHPERLVGATVYGTESNLDVMVGAEIQNVNHQVEPWSTGHSFDQFGTEHFTRPWYAPENEGVPHTYKHISVVAPPCYDTNHPNFFVVEAENTFNAGTSRFQVNFNSVPEEETTWRAAVIRVYNCGDTTVRVKPGTEPVAPFTTVVGSVVAHHAPAAYVDVRLWFEFTAGAVGTAPQNIPAVNTTVQCVGGPEFQFELIADTIHRPTVAVELALDQSGSMAWAAGTSGATRLQVLKDAATLFADLIQRNNGIGIIRFDQDAYPPNDPTFGGMPITKVLTNSFADAARLQARNVIAVHGAHGETSVGDGLVMARNQLLGLAPGDYNEKALIVLTDGNENSPVSISSASGSIDNRTFAVGLGNESQVNTAALTTIAGNTGGYLLLSGLLSASVDDQFRLRKFFLQILAAVTKTSIVRDPSGYINVGQRVRIPFPLSEADINCRVILLTDFPVVRLSVETPDGQVIDEGNAATFGVTFDATSGVQTASFNLPVASPSGPIQAGTWHAVLEVDDDAYKRAISGVSFEKNRRVDQGSLSELRTRGAKYCVSVHSFSNLRMNASVIQGGFAPGSTLSLRASLTEYNQPVERRAEVRAEVEYPDQSKAILPLAETAPGAFAASLAADLPGIYKFRLLAEGGTYRGAPFTREQILTAAVFNEVRPTPGLDDDDGRGGVAGAIERCCRRNGTLAVIIIILLIIVILLLLLRLG